MGEREEMVVGGFEVLFLGFDQFEGGGDCLQCRGRGGGHY